MHEAPVELKSLPLFPLGSVLFPEGELPLRIFEVRYLDMVGKCIQAGAPFGLVSLTQGSEVRTPNGQEAFAHIGTLATITQHQSPQPGLKIIHCVGAQRFRIERTERLKHGLWIADVSHIAPDMAVTIPVDMMTCSEALRNVMTTLAEASEDNPAAAPAPTQRWSDCAWVANRWCELLPIPLALKQKMLELENPLIRLELVNDILEKLKLV
jgi:uncharacterized protein